MRLTSKHMVLAGAVLLAGCATGVKGSARRICFDQGFQPGTQAFTECWHGIRSVQFRSDANALLAVGVVAAAANGSASVNSSPPLDDPSSSGTTMPLSMFQKKECVYHTPNGKRTLLVQGTACPLRYGE